MRARISVIIPALNEESNIERAIGSSDEADEVIVVDGGSHDATRQVAERLGAIVIVSKLGRGVQLRAGATAATGNLFLFLHADNWLADDAIEQLRDQWVQVRGGPVFGAFRQVIADRRLRFRWLEWGNALRVTWLRLPYGDQAMFIDRSTYDEIGGVQPLPLMEDVILAQSARKHCVPFLLSGPVYVNVRRWTKHGVLKQTAKNWLIMLAFRCGVPPERLAKWYR